MIDYPVLKHSGRWPAALVLGPLLAAGIVALAGCSGPIADQASAYPDLNAVPPAGKVKLLTPAEQAAAEAELKAKARAAKKQEQE